MRDRLALQNRLSLAIGMLGVIASLQAQAAEGPRTTLFEKTFLRSTTKPVVAKETFSLSSEGSEPFELTVVNGDAAGKHRVSSAMVTLNGSEILRPSDFNQSTGTLERSVSLLSYNVLNVEIRSEPGSFLRLAITGKLVWPVVTNPTLGVTINHPPGWKVQSSSDSKRLNISNVARLSPESEASLAAESLFQIRLMPGVNPHFVPIDQWFDQYLAKGLAVAPLTRSIMLVDGRSAVRIETSEIGRMVHVYVPVNSDVIDISHGVFNAAFAAQYEVMLMSVRLRR